MTTTSAPPTTTLAFPRGQRGVANGPCPQGRGSDWTPCSITCGTGVSVRTIVDPVTCATAQELRLCLLRPCEEKLSRQGREKCTSTVKLKRKRRIIYHDCISVKMYRLRFCDTCRKRKCCFPKRTRQRKIEFQCSRGKREVFNFMWIKKCRCAKKCYGKVESRGKRRRARERSKKRRERERIRKRRERERSKKRRERERNEKRERERGKKRRGEDREPKRRDKKRGDKRGRRRKNMKQ
ncbi:hypothetical protein RRG08_004701 [Elysia crispata]|uniref:CTCK domain-containing protein n=1 Tax=Elysia crispata TaxID=231223 RepID=A0AAE0ZD16_9GAST|nr:hypothetical protein RRG08_004701 [Elysia crispata]